MRAVQKLALLCPLVLCACSDEPTWRDRNDEFMAKKEESIKMYESQGMTREEAVGAWWAGEVKYNTEAGNREDVLRE